MIRLKRDANAECGPEQPVQADAAADLLQCQRRRPGRRRADAEPGQCWPSYVDHQIEVVTPVPVPLDKARARAHIVEGLLRAIDMLDAVIAAIRRSRTGRRPAHDLMAEPFSFSEDQANHILDMTLGRFTRLGRSELEEEMASCSRTIAELESILMTRRGCAR